MGDRVWKIKTSRDARHIATDWNSSRALPAWIFIQRPSMHNRATLVKRPTLSRARWRIDRLPSRSIRDNDDRLYIAEDTRREAKVRQRRKCDLSRKEFSIERILVNVVPPRDFCRYSPLECKFVTSNMLNLSNVPSIANRITLKNTFLNPQVSTVVRVTRY